MTVSGDVAKEAEAVAEEAVTPNDQTTESPKALLLLLLLSPPAPPPSFGH